VRSQCDWRIDDLFLWILFSEIVMRDSPFANLPLTQKETKRAINFEASQ
jgi:hypothetical protein